MRGKHPNFDALILLIVIVFMAVLVTAIIDPYFLNPVYELLGVPTNTPPNVRTL